MVAMLHVDVYLRQEGINRDNFAPCEPTCIANRLRADKPRRQLKGHTTAVVAQASACKLSLGLGLQRQSRSWSVDAVDAVGSFQLVSISDSQFILQLHTRTGHL